MSELDNARKLQSKPGRSPGLDGLTYEWYDKHWHIIKYDYLEVLNKSYELNELPNSMYDAIAKLIPKKGNLLDLENWRAISLLNIHYKILSRVLYEKVVGFLNDQTSKIQKGIFPGRNIYNIQLNSQSLIDYVKENNLEAAILKIDLEVLH